MSEPNDWKEDFGNFLTFTDEPSVSSMPVDPAYDPWEGE